jgi:hypothetical protein
VIAIAEQQQSSGIAATEPKPVMSRPGSATLPAHVLPEQDLQHLSEEIQSALSFASKLCFDDEGEADEDEALVRREDVRLLHAKLEGVSGIWHELLRASDVHKSRDVSQTCLHVLLACLACMSCGMHIAASPPTRLYGISGD